MEGARVVVGAMLVFSGFAGSLAAQATWNASTNFVDARRSAVVAVDLVQDRVFLYGGHSAAGDRGDLWVRTGNQWQLSIPHSSSPIGATHPGVVRGGCLVYEPATDSVLLVGGELGLPFPFWRASGNQWTPIGGVKPPQRENAAVAYDSQRQRIVLFGGRGAGLTWLSDTWSWNGSSWTQLFPPVSPQGRHSAGIAYDPLRDRIVLVGGTLFGGATNDTWEFDGTNWHQFAPATVPPSNAVALTYDVARDVVVGQFAAGAGTSAVWETWQWDGTAWTPVSTAAQPTPRSRYALFGTSAGVEMLGGDVSFTDLADCWRLSTPTPASAVAFGPSGSSPRGQLRLALRGQRPWLGSECRLAMGPLPPGIVLPGLFLGLQALPQPLDLGPFGMPGQFASITLDATWPIVNDGAGGASASIVVPFDFALLGTTVHFQGFAFEPLVGSLTTSNALSSTFGIR